MNAEVFWISETELEFCGRIYTWNGWCWIDKNGISRSSYLRDKGIIMGCGKGGIISSKLVKGDVIMAGPGKKQKGDSKGAKQGKKGKNGKKGDNEEPDNKDGDNEKSGNEESDNEEGDNEEPDT